MLTAPAATVNDHGFTIHALVVAVLYQARDNVLNGDGKSAASSLTAKPCDTPLHPLRGCLDVH